MYHSGVEESSDENGNDGGGINYYSDCGGSENSVDADSENESGKDSEGDEEESQPIGKRKLEGKHDMKRKKMKTAGKEHLKPPTVKELNQLRETQNLFHSNIFRLQIEEMLKEIKVKTKYQKLFEDWFKELKSNIEQIANILKQINMKDLKWLKNMKGKISIIRNIMCETEVFEFLPPSSISVIGSWRQQCCIGPDVTVDINVEMPKACFKKSDYLNLRYHEKRYLYLGHIAGSLERSGVVEDISFYSLHGNSLMPVLKLKPAGRLNKHILVLLHVSAESTSLKISRFAPSKNNVRQFWNCGGPDAVQNDDPSPTPHYNSSVARNLCTINYNEYLMTIMESHTNIRDGVILLKIWLRQRELDKGQGAFSGFIMTMYVAYLFNMHRLYNTMSSYQVARYVWNSLAQADWTKTGISLAPPNMANVPPLSEFHEHFEVVFVDTSGYCNLCSDMVKETFQTVRREAELAIKFLDDNSVNSFQALFMTKMPFYRQFDHIICVRGVKPTVSTYSPTSTQLDWAGQVRPQALALILPLLRRGLGSRILYLGVSLETPMSWHPSKKPCEDDPQLVFGLRLDSEHAYKLVDKGPEANTLEAEKFRKFWGEKSELRRFQDGTIAEAVVWKQSATLAEKRDICRHIVEYVLEKHLQTDTSMSITYISNQLESFLHLNKIKPAEFEYGTGEEATLAVISSYDRLANQLRKLKELPLQISTVQGNSAVFRYCEVFPPLATSAQPKRSICTESSFSYIFLENSAHKMVPSWVQPVEVIVTLEMSGKWPNDLEAVRRIRAAFNIRISQCLREQFNLVSQPHQDYVDVLKDGFVFRLRIAYLKEISLLKEIITPLGVTKYRDNPRSLALEKNFVHLPKLTSALHGLHKEHPSYGPAACLAKRWLCSHMIDASHMPTIAVELIVASLYTSPEPYTPPQQPQSAFFHFLHRLASTDWNLQPLIININNKMDSETISSLEKHFHGVRKSLPPLFIATPSDTMHSIWTKEGPSLSILVRVASLAAEALKVVEEQVFAISPHFEFIFTPSTDLYDVCIYLNPMLIARRSESLNIKTDKAPKILASYKPQAQEKLPIIGFDPVQCYLKDLRENYGDFALFFHNTFGGDLIGVLWKPTTKEEREFKVSVLRGHKLVSSDPPKITVNIEAVIEDFKAMGSTLVKSIQKK